jgi:hypothetical protein
MDKYFVVNPECALCKDYFAYRDDVEKINEAFKSIASKYGIETHSYYPSKILGIAGTKNDLIKFKNKLKKDSEFFKLKSEINKEWGELTKDISIWRKPNPSRYLSKWIMSKHNTRLFAIDGVLYGSIETEESFETEEWMQEMKASEFFKIIEDYKESGEKKDDN